MSRGSHIGARLMLRTHFVVVSCLNDFKLDLWRARGSRRLRWSV